jgi:hypothetical protein
MVRSWPAFLSHGPAIFMGHCRVDRILVATALAMGVADDRQEQRGERFFL